MNTHNIFYMALSRTQGHKWERDCITKLAEVLELEKFQPKVKNEMTAEIGSTRMFSRRMDNDGIDIWMKEPFINVQCKKTLSKGKSVTTIDIQSLLDLEEKFPEEFNVLLTRITQPAKSRERKLAEVMVIPYELGIKMLTLLYEYTRNKE